MALSKDVRFRPLKTILYPGAAGQTRDSLPVTEVYQSLNCRLTGNYTADTGIIAGVANNAEGTISLIRKLTIEGSSNRRRAAYGAFKATDFAAYYNINRFLRNIAGVTLDLGAGSLVAKSGPDPFAADVQVDFEMPHTSDPRRTYLNAARDLETLTVVIDWGDTSDLIQQAPASLAALTATQLQISGRELLDPTAKNYTYGINTFSYIEKVVTAAAPAFEFDLRRGNLLRGFLIKAFTVDPTAGAAPFHIPSDAIVNYVKFSLNRETKLEFNDWQTLQGQNVLDYRMPLITPITGYAFVDFMEDGNFNKIIPTSLYRDVTLTLGVAAPAAAPVVTYVRVYPVEIFPANNIV